MINVHPHKPKFLIIYVLLWFTLVSLGIGRAVDPSESLVTAAEMGLLDDVRQMLASGAGGCQPARRP